MILHENFPLKDILFYRIGGTAKIVIETKSTQDILDAFDYIKNHNIKKFLVIGLGANLVMQDGDFDGAIVWISKSSSPYIKILDEEVIEVYAGQTLDELIQFMFANSYKGLEVLGGLPSTVGGAIRGNAGAFGVEMKDVLIKTEVLDTSTGDLRIYSNEECNFSYRDSIFKHNRNLVILRGFFKFAKATNEEAEEAKKVYQDNIAYREKNHPVEYPSCGSVFKNIREPEDVRRVLSVWPDIDETVKSKWHGKVSMGYVIKRLGLQGVQVGGAKVTEKHANYISNINNATHKDVVSIIDKIKEKFHATFGFYPELEAEIIED